MKDNIIHGIPKQDFFAIAVPATWLYKPIDGEGAVISLEDPKTHVKTKVQIEDTWTFELEDFKKMDGFSKLVYGLPATKVAPILKIKYPEIEESNVVRFVLLRKI